MSAISSEMISANRQVLRAFAKVEGLTKLATKATDATESTMHATAALGVLSPALGLADQLALRGALLLPMSSVRLATSAERSLETAIGGGWNASFAIKDAHEGAQVAVYNGKNAMKDPHIQRYRVYPEASSRATGGAGESGSSSSYVDGQHLDALGWPMSEPRSGFGPDGGGYDEFPSRGSGGGYTGPDGATYSGRDLY